MDDSVSSSAATTKQSGELEAASNLPEQAVHQTISIARKPRKGVAVAQSDYRASRVRRSGSWARRQR